MTLLNAMATLKPRFSFQELDLFLTQQDTLSALVVWVVLEALSLIMLPSFTLITGEHPHLTWIVLSGSLGVLGAILIGLSSGVIQYCHDMLPRKGSNKQFLIGGAQVVSWLGLIGVGFPMIMVVIELGLVLAKGTPA